MEVAAQVAFQLSPIIVSYALKKNKEKYTDRF